jgi:hypothetical protein
MNIIYRRSCELDKQKLQDDLLIENFYESIKKENSKHSSKGVKSAKNSKNNTENKKLPFLTGNLGEISGTPSYLKTKHPQSSKIILDNYSLDHGKRDLLYPAIQNRSKFILDEARQSEKNKPTPSVLSKINLPISNDFKLRLIDADNGESPLEKDFQKIDKIHPQKPFSPDKRITVPDQIYDSLIKKQIIKEKASFKSNMLVQAPQASLSLKEVDNNLENGKKTLSIEENGKNMHKKKSPFCFIFKCFS